MRSKLLLGTAVLVASVALAAAQNMPGGGQSAPAQHQGAQSQGSQGGQGGAAQDRERSRGGQAQQGTGGESKQTTGQGTQREQGMERRGAEKEKAQPQRSQRERDHTTGQSPSQTQQSQPGMQRQQGQQTQPSQGQAQQGRTGANVQLTSEQRTQIRQSVLAGSNVPRANNVNFALTVGTAVPTTVHVVEVPTVLVNIHPEWRGFFYFVVRDEIIIVDRGHKIVAVIAV